MAMNRKYAALPDLVNTHAVLAFSTRLHAKLMTTFQDSAPDIYETPELTDDTSTVPVRIPWPWNHGDLC